jgi:hypothetical protein
VAGMPFTILHRRNPRFPHPASPIDPLKCPRMPQKCLILFEWGITQFSLRGGDGGLWVRDRKSML